MDRQAGSRELGEKRCELAPAKAGVGGEAVVPGGAYRSDRRHHLATGRRRSAEDRVDGGGASVVSAAEGLREAIARYPSPEVSSAAPLRGGAGAVRLRGARKGGAGNGCGVDPLGQGKTRHARALGSGEQGWGAFLEQLKTSPQTDDAAGAGFISPRLFRLRRRTKYALAASAARYRGAGTCWLLWALLHRSGPSFPPFPTRRVRCRGTLPFVSLFVLPRLRPPSLFGSRSRKEPKALTEKAEAVTREWGSSRSGGGRSRSSQEEEGATGISGRAEV